MNAFQTYVAQKSRTAAYESLFPDYPSNARSFISLDSRLLPYWHLIFDLCPSLLKLDPPEGLELFRRFMTWAYRHQPAQDWTFHISFCRWLLKSEYAQRVTDVHIDDLLCAAAARWASGDNSLAQGIMLSCPAFAMTTVEWKTGRMDEDGTSQWVPPARFDFAWSPLSRGGIRGFHRWLRIPQ